ncbi:PepSY domain-containing protein [Frigoribacterium sp. PvP032]|uniref:PepSY domain-containing protein n=1 Tax=Frigoribacterium sp. PvP032 TaxID=2806589 RepID=UPI001AEB255A|nr:PepSY domain-containing protein [Frigoribacterium sp. PvP032]MBP1189629.1 putative membrane protein YkoI [Frigoribacterium sp. PvP032]
MKNVLKSKKSLLIAGGVVGVLVLGGGGVAVASTLDDRVGGAANDRAQEAALAETGGGTVTDVDRLDDGLPGYEVDVVLPDGRESTVLLGDDFSVSSSRIDDDRDDRSDRSGSDDRDSRYSRDDDDLSDDSTSTPGASSTPGSASTSGADDDDLVGADFDQAAAAAIAAAGGGTVTDADRSDDGTTAYEVDVRLDDGTEVDVDLDASFGVLRTDVDDRR